jgi:hypothetical protein
LGKLSWRNRTAVLGMLGALLGSAPSAGSYSGGQPGAYLRAPVGAAAFAMGGAQTANPHYLCSWWNPASLVLLESRRLSLGTGLKSLGRIEGFFGWEFAVPPRAAIGLSLLYRGDPYMSNLRDAQENRLDPASYTTATVKIGLSYYAAKNIAAGINSSVLYQRLPTSYTNTAPQYSSAASLGGFDVGIAYKFRKNVRFGLTLQNLLVISNWEISSLDMLNVTVQDTFAAPVTVGSSVRTQLRGKPLEWSCDLKVVALNSSLKRLEHPEAVLGAGAQWERWQTVHLRAGIGDITLNRDMVRDRSVYREDFSFRFCAGFWADLSGYARGLGLNYCMSTDKVWAFVDQQIDLMYRF